MTDTERPLTYEALRYQVSQHLRREYLITDADITTLLDTEVARIELKTGHQLDSYAYYIGDKIAAAAPFKIASAAPLERNPEPLDEDDDDDDEEEEEDYDEEEEDYDEEEDD